MSNFFYRILWVDDQHEDMMAFKGRAKTNGFTLEAFKGFNAAIDELERNYSLYDGILLDAKFYENENDEPGSEDTEFSILAQKRILQLPKQFKVFVLTGQSDTYADRTYRKVFNKVYAKGSEKDLEQLFIDLKEAAQTQPDAQIRYLHRRVFDVCTDRYVGKAAGQDLLKLLKRETELGTEDYFTAIRKIIEDLFRAFHKYDLLPGDFIRPSVAINESSRFLEGQTIKGYQQSQETYLPRPIANSLKYILSITQDASHRAVVDAHVRLTGTSYLFQGVLFQVMEILVWFKLYVGQNPLRNNWSKIELNNLISNTISGSVINKNPKGFAFFKPDNGGENSYIPNNLVALHNLNNGVKILVEIEDYIDNKTGGIKKQVKRIEG